MTGRLVAEFDDQPTGHARGGEEGNRPTQVLTSVPPTGVTRSLQPLIEPLTPREIEVLMLLRDPLSLKEIARQLFISYQTVKRHTVNIYGKLDVHRRRAAVAKAEALGLIPPR